jgi:hypothetical protein
LANGVEQSAGGGGAVSDDEHARGGGGLHLELLSLDCSNGCTLRPSGQEIHAA